MSEREALWSAVDKYITDMLVPSDPALDAAMESAAKAGLPPIAVTPAQGKFLYILARLLSARQILELGTLAGYSSIWLARALPEGGRLVTVEAERAYAAIAQANIARAGLASRVEVRIGRALSVMAQIKDEGEGPFDIFFIDADKKSIPEYFQLSLQLSRPGSLIIVDNVVRDGRVIDAKSHDPDIQGIRIFNQLAAREPRVCVTALQTVGAKGHDGFAIALVTS